MVSNRTFGYTLVGLALIVAAIGLTSGYYLGGESSAEAATLAPPVASTIPVGPSVSVVSDVELTPPPSSRVITVKTVRIFTGAAVRKVAEKVHPATAEPTIPSPLVGLSLSSVAEGSPFRRPLVEHGSRSPGVDETRGAAGTSLKEGQGPKEDYEYKFNLGHR